MNVRQFQGSNLHTTDGQDGEIVELAFGDTALHSGLYEVIHAASELESRTTTVLLRGERVERCGRCGQEVRLRLVHAAPHILEDGDFCPEREPE